jgi:hypothetical protein
MEANNDRLQREHHERVTRRIGVASVIIATCALVLTSYQISTIREITPNVKCALTFTPNWR